jgi:putative zinc finger/helix-turn-helix YgiT family protein
MECGHYRYLGRPADGGDPLLGWIADRHGLLKPAAIFSGHDGPFLKEAMRQKKKVCPSCGEGELRRGEAALTREVGEHQFSAKVAASVCEACGEIITDLQVGERFDLAVASLLAEASPTGDAFRFLRKVAGLRARDVARMLGLTGDTISRWENGKHAIDRSAFFILGQIVRERQQGSTAMLDLLARGELPKALPARVDVHLE